MTPDGRIVVETDERFVLLKRQIRARLARVCSEMIPEDFDNLVSQIAKMETRWLSAPSQWSRRGPGG